MRRFGERAREELLHHAQFSFCFKVAEFDANDLKTPSKLLEAKSANKKEAQYFFSKDTLAYLIDAIKVPTFRVLGTVHKSLRNGIRG